eukprot:IDg14821t1
MEICLISVVSDEKFETSTVYAAEFMTPPIIFQISMVFGMRLFSGGSPTKRGVDPNAPRIADRVEGGGEEAAAQNAASAAAVGPDSTDSEELTHVTSSEAISPDASGVTTMPLSPANSARTLLPSVSAVVLGPEATAMDTEGELHSVPLTAIPDFVISEHPQLKLTAYDLGRGNHCSNAIAMPHNAARLEMADMWSDILPSLRSRPIESLTRDDGSDLTQWWGGFARFV